VTAHPHRPHVNRRLVGFVALAAALVGLGGWLLANRYTGGGGATQDATTLIDKFNAAASANDAKAASALLTFDVEVWMPSGSKIVGPKGFATYALGPGLRVQRTAPVTVEGDFATTFVSFTLPGMQAGQQGHAAMVFQLASGKILRAWSFQLGVTKPFDNAVMP
jgi:SnoaL-like protein